LGATATRADLLPARRPAVRTPGPRGSRMAWQLLTRANLLDVLAENAHYGDLMRFNILRKPFISVRAPEHLRHVLVTNQDNYRKSFQYRLLAVGGLGNGLLTNEGESWSAQRRLIQPMFAKRHLGRFAAHMTTGIADFVADWECEPHGERVDVAAAMNALALDVVGRALFGAQLADEAARLRPAVLVGLRSGVLAARLQLVAAAPRWVVDVGAWMLFHLPLPTRGQRRLRDGLNTIGDVVNGLIEARERDPEADPGDLLGLLLAARDDDGRAMSRDQVADELVTFMLAGHETTANGLAWMWYLLSQHPEAREQLLAEVDDVLGGRLPTAEDADRLKWTAACFQEALRLRSPVWMLEREAIGEDHIDGHRIPAGATILVPVHLVHHDPRLWPDPERFDPSRFLPDQVHEHPRGAYMPFGAGRRVCIGAGFSILEATLITAMIAQRFTLDLAPGARVVPETTITLRPRHGLPMTIQRR
jgi:cytochrome P450